MQKFTFKFKSKSIARVPNIEMDFSLSFNLDFGISEVDFDI